MILNVWQFRQEERALRKSHNDAISQNLCAFLTSKGYVLCNDNGYVGEIKPTKQYPYTKISFLKSIPDTRSEPKADKPFKLPFVASIEWHDDDIWTMAIHGTKYIREMLDLNKQISENFNVDTKSRQGYTNDMRQSFLNRPEIDNETNDDQ